MPASTPPRPLRWLDKQHAPQPPPFSFTFFCMFKCSIPTDRLLRKTFFVFVLSALGGTSLSLGIPALGWAENNKPIKRIGINCQRLTQTWKIARYKRLEAEDIEGMDWHHLEILRNGIYARHYMPFSPPRLRYFFMDKKTFPWYRAWKTWNQHRVSRMEWDNASLISQKERALGAIDKRYRLRQKHRLRYFCTQQATAKDDEDPQWDRFKPTPFPVHVHCQEIDQQIQRWTQTYLTKSDLYILQRKGWLHLSLLRNGLFAYQGHPLKTPWLQRFYRRFAWHRKHRRSKPITAAIRYNAQRLFALEQKIGTMRLSIKQYNLDVRCAGSDKPQALTLRQKAVLMALSFLGTSRFQYNQKVRNLQLRVAGRSNALTARRIADRYDCSGLVESVFQGLEMNLAQPAPRPHARYWNTNGVKIILYNLLHRYNVTCDKRAPKPGDLVFFDNCWDANENGTSRDDPLTHIGIVTGVYPDGTVEFVHNAGTGWSRRIEIGRLNLKLPYSKAHNKPYPMCSGMVPAKVFRCYAFPKEESAPLLAKRNPSTSSEDEPTEPTKPEADSPTKPENDEHPPTQHEENKSDPDRSNGQDDDDRTTKRRRYASRSNSPLYAPPPPSASKRKFSKRKTSKRTPRRSRRIRKKKKNISKKKAAKNKKRQTRPSSDLNSLIDEHDPL